VSEGPRGTLYVVATPIGNLGDVTVRALDVLRSVAVVAAEDTRITRRLFERHGIGTRLVAYHARSTPARAAELLGRLEAGGDVALVTDAGTPLVSDPGEGLVAAWARAGGRVVPVPGASSLLAAVAASGIAGPRWTFEGFLPRSGRERRGRLRRIADDERGSVLFEAPTRLRPTLADLADACGADRPAAVCRELTKLHEQIVRGTLAGLEASVASGDIPARGEVVIVVGWQAQAHPADVPTAGSLETARAEVEALVASGLARGEAARRVATASGIPRRALYGAGSDRGG